MNTIKSCFGAVLSSIALLLIPTFQAQAQAWPTKTVRWIVPFGAGGAADAIARMLAQKLGEKWGQQVVVENKPGGNTVIGATEGMRAAPDGYTLFQAINSTLTLNPFTFSKLPYDPIRDFTHIALLAAVPMVIVGSETLPAKSMPELIAYAKANPGRVTMGGGNVSIQLAVERLSRDAGVKFTYVPYKTGIEVTKGLLSGEIQVGIDGAIAYLPLAKSGKVKILATNSPQRNSSLPDIPALAEFGLRNSDAGLWHGLVAPAGLPRDIKQKIEADLRAVLTLPDVKERMAAIGLEPMWGTSEQFLKLIETESAAMGPLAKDLGLKME